MNGKDEKAGLLTTCLPLCPGRKQKGECPAVSGLASLRPGGVQLYALEMGRNDGGNEELGSREQARGVSGAVAMRGAIVPVLRFFLSSHLRTVCVGSSVGPGKRIRGGKRSAGVCVVNEMRNPHRQQTRTRVSDGELTTTQKQTTIQPSSSVTQARGSASLHSHPQTCPPRSTFRPCRRGE